MGSLRFSCFWTGTFGMLLLIDSYIPSSARAYLFAFERLWKSVSVRVIYLLSFIGVPAGLGPEGSWDWVVVHLLPLLNERFLVVPQKSCECVCVYIYIYISYMCMFVILVMMIVILVVIPCSKECLQGLAMKTVERMRLANVWWYSRCIIQHNTEYAILHYTYYNITSYHIISHYNIIYHIYIYTHRERDVYVYIYIYIHTHTYVYIYIYIYMYTHVHIYV